jgi:molybdopterin synthase catalytic subunit
VTSVRSVEAVPESPQPPQMSSVEFRDDEVWIRISAQVLHIDDTFAWTSRPSCGAVVSFAGTVRDHSEGRPGVSSLEYEVYAERALERLLAVADSARRRWPMIGRIALHHRTGRLAVTDISVLVAVSTPHRAEAFDAGEFCIDTLKRTVPVWKHETWVGGSGWSECVHELEDPVG